jgi:phosphate transport system protein
MGDYATNIAKLAQQLAKEPELPIFRQIPRMEQLCREQLHSAMRALVDVSEEEARAVCRGDDEIDHLYNSVYEDAMSLMELSPERARQATHMLFAAHHLERLGDRVTNIGEDVVFLATGRVEDLNP